MIRSLLFSSLALLALSQLGCNPPPAVRGPSASRASSNSTDARSDKGKSSSEKGSEPTAAQTNSTTAGESTKASPGPGAVDPELPDYEAVAGVSGTIRSVGSDTMNNLMTVWAEGFKKYYPNVTYAVEGKGTSTAMPALQSGAANFGPMSRDVKQEESTAFQKQFGYKPTLLPTSLDMLAVFVNKDNPLEGLSLQQVDAIFSSTRKLGGKEDINTWGQLGLKDAWAEEPISLYGRNAASGTYGYFKEHALGNGDFRDAVKVQPGSSGVVQAIATDAFAIGYTGIGYATADVRALPLAKKEGDPFVPALAENAYSQKYPLSRALLIAVNYDSTKDLDPLRREFIKYIYSKQGQTDVVSDGYLPLPAKVAKKALATVGLSE
jgi:phosphate transport system substrate-binding protein